jgi:hypothetical protein
MPEAAHREAQKPSFGGHIKQDLRDCQADQLGVGDLRASSCTSPPRQEIGSQHVKCRQKGVEIGGHVDHLLGTVDVDVRNADLRHPFYVPSPPRAATRGTESVI